MAINDDVENYPPSEEVREPLIQVVEKNNLTNNNQGEEGGSDRSTHQWMVYLSTFVAVCGSYEFGNCVGYSSPTQSAITDELNLSTAEYSVFGSILSIGAMLGAITSGPIGDWVGRKGALWISSAFCIAGWLAIIFAEGAMALFIGRLLTGYGMGVYSYVVPVFIAEIAPKNLRGALTTINQFMICLAVSVNFIIGNVISWRALAATALIPCVLVGVGLFFIPESPRWLAKYGGEKQFETALQKLRGKDADITLEAAEIKDYIETLDSLPKPKLLDLVHRRYLRSVIIGVGLMVIQQFGGINGICFYVANIFESAGLSATFGTITYAILQVIVTGLSAVFIDRAGRKPLLLISGSGLVLGSLLAALAFLFQTYGWATDAVPALTLTGILLYIGSFSFGMGAVPWVVMSEIFPINVKGLAGSIATLVNWFGAWAVSFTFNFLMDWSSYGTFLLYAAVNVLGLIFVTFVVPETKGRTLEQIQAAINGE